MSRSLPTTWAPLLAVALIVTMGGVTFPQTDAARALLQASSSSNTWAPNLDLLTEVVIPSEIDVPTGNSLKGAIRAEGLQHYRFNGTAWVQVNATANLYNSASSIDVVGNHFFLGEPDADGGQPSWAQMAVLTAVTAKKVAAKTVNPDCIAWNLLLATSHSGLPQDALGSVTYVQRLETRQGLPPSGTEGYSKGDTYVSPYFAVYAFYVASS